MRRWKANDVTKGYVQFFLLEEFLYSPCGKAVESLALLAFRRGFEPFWGVGDLQVFSAAATSFFFRQARC